MLLWMTSLCFWPGAEAIITHLPSLQAPSSTSSCCATHFYLLLQIQDKYEIVARLLKVYCLCRLRRVSINLPRLLCWLKEPLTWTEPQCICHRSTEAK
ncbi:hypothetical protein BKA61DRAFT_619678 [Leptodontidium sp. MPI-SDFR-AT-0119]|nr:hypothetical protein BKA61DRAFT_619678 [Leptodontidium sp. MPI-SDFR-AT-0119]